MLPAWRPHKLTRQQLQERRLHAQQLLEQGHRPRDITHSLGIASSTLRTWKQKLHQHGDDALHATVSTGRPRALNDEARHELRLLLRQGAKAHGYDDDTWTTLRVRDLIAQHFGIHYHRDHVGALLKQMCFSYQKPETRALERDEKQVRTWVDTTLPELGKKD